MKREIKFRGKTIESSIGWIYGDLIQSPGIIPVIQRFEKTIEIKGEKCQLFSQDKVHPQTVGQFTGVTDGEGREIYEDDIVAIYHEKHCTFKGKVEFLCGQFVVNSKDKLITALSRKPWQVIGNIHDNPELMEGGEG